VWVCGARQDGEYRHVILWLQCHNCMRLGGWYDGCCCINTCVDPSTRLILGVYNASFHAAHCLFDRIVYGMLHTSMHLDLCFIVVVG